MSMSRTYINGQWANPPWSVIQRIYHESCNAIHNYGNSGIGILGKQYYLRRVSNEFHRRLKEAGIYVET